MSELRHAGLHVSLVGLNMQRLVGAHGLPLVPDIPLEQALLQAHLARCVIVPCQAKYLAQFSYDPRLAEFFRRLAANNTLLVGEAGLRESKTVEAMLPPGMMVLEYASDDDLEHVSKVIQRTIAGNI